MEGIAGWELRTGEAADLEASMNAGIVNTGSIIIA
jgi:hypothetical protein